MKKRTKQILAGVLALSVLLGTPAGVQAVDAAGRMWTKETLAEEDANRDTSGEGALTQEDTDKNPFAQDDSEQDTSAQAPFERDAFAQDPSEQDAFDQAPFERDAFAQASTEQDAFAQAPFERDAFAQDPSEKDLSGQDDFNEELSEQDDSNQALSEQDNFKQELSEQDRFEQDLSEQDDSNQELSEQDDSNQDLSEQDDSNQELSEQDDSEQEFSEQDTSDQAPSDQDTSDEEASTGETLDAKFFEEDPDALLELQNDSAQSLMEEKIELRPLEVSVEISGNGELDYRTYMDQAVSFHIRVKNSEAKQGLSEEAAYQLTIDNTGIVDFGNVSGTVSYDGAMGTLNTQKSSAALKVKGVGETGYTVTVSGMAGFEEASYSGSIQVKNSALRDSDFYIEMSAEDGQVQRYAYSEWLAYLKGCDAWVASPVAVRLSDAGKRYFSQVKVEEQTDAEAHSGKKKYVFWAENPANNASTKEVPNGKRHFTAGFDAEAPVLEDLLTKGVCHEPTRTDTKQYFAEDFILRGVCRDAVSGVSRVVYTADAEAGNAVVWKEAEIQDCAQEGQNDTVDFVIRLADGIYPALAVRAYDMAGNASETVRYLNEEGRYIQVVVDRKEPVLKLEAASAGRPYHGEGDNWTNEDVRIAVTLDRDSCPYAGIYQYEYVYRKIGEDMTDVSENWTALPVDGRLLDGIDIAEDKNGYFVFRAVSMSGAASKEVQQRVLIQHAAADIKPLIESGADRTKCKDGWYNKQSKTPVIGFAYPDYDTGVTSGEYDAPITLHYRLTRETAAPDTEAESEGERRDTNSVEKAAVIGVLDGEDVTVQPDKSKVFAVKKDDLNQYTVDFGYDQETGAAQDGYYTLEYWTTDRAGNESERQVHNYKIDCHEPTDLTLELAGSAFDVGEDPAVTYERFYRDAVPGSAQAQYGISGKGSLTVLPARRVGEWKNKTGATPMDADSFRIHPNMRGFLYVRAEDAAGNVAEGWTKGIVVDNMAPNDDNPDGRELIVAPKGANEHGFFNKDVAIEIQIKDAPDEKNCAALRTVTCSVGRDGADTIADQEIFSFTKNAPTEEELIEASRFQGTQVIDAQANESNEAYIEVTATDRSDNAKTTIQMLKIDVTKPEIDIRFDNNDAENGSYYRAARTATIHVRELNFDPDAVQVAVTRDNEPVEMMLSGWTQDGSGHYATLTFAEDGTYQIQASCVDLADNASDVVQSERFTIDRTAPVIAVGLLAGQEAQTPETDCFNQHVTAAITVTERNFRAEDFAINMTHMSEMGVWTHEGDTHTLRVLFDSDGAYHIDCAYTDLAGNPAQPAQKDFVVDTTAPAVTIAGVADGSANSGAILPVIAVTDQNIAPEGVSVTVTTGVGGAVDKAVAVEPMEDAGVPGFRLTLTDLTDKPDNIYRLTVSARDRAGNKTERTCRFSLNRNGSVYDLTSLMSLMEHPYHRYDALGEIVVTEMNIDTVEEFALYVSRNGALGYRAAYTKEVGGSADTGYTYTYHIKNENFSEEGTYRLSMYSRDRAGNEVNNAADIHGNEIAFVVDNTPPRVVIDGVASGKVYDVEKQEVRVCVTDNFRLAEARFTLVNRKNEILQSWDYMELAGEGQTLNITIGQRDEEVSLLYQVRDAAGNEMETAQGERAALDRFLVTTDKFVQLVNRPSQTPLGRIAILGTGASGVAGVLFAAARAFRRRRLKYLS